MAKKKIKKKALETYAIITKSLPELLEDGWKFVGNVLHHPTSKKIKLEIEQLDRLGQMLRLNDWRLRDLKSTIPSITAEKLLKTKSFNFSNGGQIDILTNGTMAVGYDTLSREQCKQIYSLLKKALYPEIPKKVSKKAKK